MSAARAWVLVRAAGELYAWPAAAVEEVRAATAVTPVPQARGALRGVVRGQASFLPVIDLAAFLGRSRVEGDAVLVVGRWGDRPAAWLVDDVVDVIELDDALWAPPPPGSPPYVRAVAPVGGTLVARLDPAVASHSASEETE